MFTALIFAFAPEEDRLLVVLVFPVLWTAEAGGSGFPGSLDLLFSRISRFSGFPGSLDGCFSRFFGLEQKLQKSAAEN